jgi:hypothetical protein
LCLLGQRKNLKLRRKLRLLLWCLTERLALLLLVVSGLERFQRWVEHLQLLVQLEKMALRRIFEQYLHYALVQQGLLLLHHPVRLQQ